jgi:hypothetical protein
MVMRGKGVMCSGLMTGLLILAGCGGMAEVSGTVSLDGHPVEEGAIHFSPVDGQTPTAGALIKNGQYRAQVPVGLMKVSLTAPKVVGKKKIYPTKDSPEMPVTKEALPEKYNLKSELQFEVKPGSNQKDFELHSK